MNPLLLVTTTTADLATAEAIARELVERRLVACAQISGPVESLYRWQGQLEQGEERVVTFKTTAVHLAAVQQTVERLHPYQVPELIATPIVDGSAAYRKWLQEETDAGN